MKEWKDVTETFSEDERHYKDTYLEICEVLDENELSLFSSEVGPYEIYVSYGEMYGIVYSDASDAYQKRDEIKKVIEDDYLKNGKPSNDFINDFAEKYGLELASDIFFDTDALFDALLDLNDIF